MTAALAPRTCVNCGASYVGRACFLCAWDRSPFVAAAPDADARSPVRLRLAQVRAAVVAALRATPGLYLSELAAEIGVTSWQTKLAVDHLVRGLAIVGKGVRGGKRQYFVRGRVG